MKLFSMTTPRPISSALTRSPVKVLSLVCAGLYTVFFLGGCASYSRSSGVYNAGEAQTESSVRFAVVESIRQVEIRQRASGVGGLAGAVAGGIAGGSVGQGRGSGVASVLGAVGGGMVGNAIENSGNLKQGLEITVRLENGELRAIVQEADVSFSVGQPVRLVTSQYGVTRVSPR